MREHLDVLSTRFRGADALALRQRPVPHAYRVAFRHVGLDPDVTRTPIEAAAIERLVQGGFVSRGLLDDALTIALVETGVPLWALDAEAVDGELSAAPRARRRAARRARRRRRRCRTARSSSPTRARRSRRCSASRRRTASRADARRACCCTPLRVDGVPLLHVQEALWQCAETLLAALTSTAATMPESGAARVDI